MVILILGETGIFYKLYNASNNSFTNLNNKEETIILVPFADADQTSDIVQTWLNKN